MDARGFLELFAGLHVGPLQRRGDVDGLIRALRRHTLRPEAARALGGLGNSRAVDPLLRLLNHPASRGRREAAWALGRLGGEPAIEALVAGLDDWDPDVGSAAAQALVELGDPRALDPPLAAHEREVCAVVRAIVDPLVAAGHAALLLEHLSDQGSGRPPPAIRVRPSNLEACPVTVQIDYFKQVSLFMGGPTWCETWHEHRADYLRWVREAVEAVTEGRYEDWIHDDGRRAKGVFHLSGGPEPFYNNVIRTSAVGGPGWKHRHYAPYGAVVSGEQVTE